MGIDISSAAVKLVELSLTGSDYKVESYAAAPLPREALGDNSFANTEVIAETIRSIIKKSGTKLRQAAVAVPASAVITKVITMPGFMDENELEAQIELEADQYIPYALDEVSIDFIVQGVSEKNAESIDVLLIASRKENVTDRTEALELAGIKPVIVDVESYAQENAISLFFSKSPDEQSDQTVALIDIGANVTNLNVIDKRKIIFSREQGFGGRQLTEEIQRRYGLSAGESGYAKKNGGLPDNYETEVLHPFKLTLSQQIGRSLQFFLSSGIHRNVEQIVLAGGCASIPRIDHFVEEALGIPTVIANPFIHMSHSSRVNKQDLNNDAPALLTACGLALRSFEQ